MPADYYAKPADIRQATQVQPGDLGLQGVAELDGLLERWLRLIRDWIDRDRRRNFLAEAGEDPDAVPGVVKLVAERAAKNMVAQAIVHRETPVITVEERSFPTVVIPRAFTAELRELLATIPRGSASSLRMFTTHKDT